MKKSVLLFVLVLSCIFQGCYEDKGNYSYKEFSDPVVTGIAKFYTVYLGGNYDIRPTIQWTKGELENYTYTWRIDGKVVSREKDLTGKVEGIPVRGNMFSEFVITDEDTGVEYITPFKIAVVSEYAKGWLVLANKDGRGELSLIRNDKVLHSDVCHVKGEYDLPGKVTGLFEHWLPWSDELGQVFVACQDESEYSVELDGNSLRKVISTKDEFVGGVPDDFKPVSMICVPNYDYLVSNGKLYVRYVEHVFDALYQEGAFPNFPFHGNFDYKLSNWHARGNLMFSYDIITFDELSGSYLLLREGELSKFDYINDSEKAFKPTDMDKVLLGGGAVSTESPTDSYITFLKSKSGNEAWVHQFCFSGWSNKKYRSISEMPFPDPSIFNENTKFAVCQNRPYVYIASGSILYVYNYNDNTLKMLRTDFKRPILDIACCPTDYERLGVVLENAGDPGKSDFLELDVSVISGGKNVEGMEFIGMFGRAVDLVYKIGIQSDVQ